ncbi:MAG: CoxG family protein [Gemmobacter sp.]
MNIAGVLQILAPPERVRAALHDAAVLQRMLPACEGVQALGPGRFRAQVARKMGLLTLRLAPDIVLLPHPQGLGLDLTVTATSRIAGSVEALLSLTMRREPLGTRLFWDGAVATTGMAQRLLADRQGQIGARVAAMFGVLKGVLEG